ncbi:MAG: MbcA/ParS/Xre antitoxin family protein [Granulosicoccus sp.]|nr:MbcA/ParS/Xre antitoxin family protein [Granulosicoccus sp.]
MTTSSTGKKPSRSVEPASEEQTHRAALQVFFGITADWKLSSDAQRVLLGSIPESTFFKWKKELKGRLSVDTLDRVSYVMGIHKALRILLGDVSAVRRWIHAPNSAPLFGGLSAIERMTTTGQMEDLAAIRRYLDAERGW